MTLKMWNRTQFIFIGRNISNLKYKNFLIYLNALSSYFHLIALEIFLSSFSLAGLTVYLISREITTFNIFGLQKQQFHIVWPNSISNNKKSTIALELYMIISWWNAKRKKQVSFPLVHPCHYWKFYFFNHINMVII